MRTLKKNKLFIVLLALILILPMGEVFATGAGTSIKLNVRTVKQTITMSKNQVPEEVGVVIENPSETDIQNLTAQARIENPTTVFVQGDSFSIDY